MAKFLLLNGPNLDLLGTREPETYGAQTLAAIEQHLSRLTTQAGHELACFQSNSESALIERVHATAAEELACTLFNPAAFTHTSIALRDAAIGVDLVFIEIHLSNIAAREGFRHASYFADIALGTIAGFGAQGYELALDAAIQRADSASTRLTQA